MTIERTLQQRDPLAAIVARPTTYLVGAGVPLYAGVLLWLNRDDIDSFGLAVGSLFVLSLTAVYFVYSTSPLRAPFTRAMFAVVLSGGIVSHVLAAASMYSSNSFVRDDWGPPAIGLLIAAVAAYRPAREIALAGAIAVVVVVIVVAAQAQSLETTFPFHLVALVAAAPVAVLAGGAAIFSRELDAGLERWSNMRTMSLSALGDGGSEWIARSVQQDRVTLLNQEIIPFFESVLAAPQLTQSERSRASELSSAIRAIMVAEIDRSWLDALLENEARAHGDPRIMRRVNDPHGLADDMLVEQRTAMRAFVVALFAHPACNPESVDMVISHTGDHNLALMRASVAAPEITVRGALDPYLAVLRIVFPDLHVDFEQPELTLRFSYGERRDRS